MSIKKSDNKKKLLEEMIRVNHAGESGAIWIYQAQKLILHKKDKGLAKIVGEMENQEYEHLNYFTDQMVKRKVRPTVFSPLWKLGSFTLGSITAVLGKNATMTTTEAVESVIADHYQQQIDLLSSKIFEDNKEDKDELKSKITKFREDEIAHHDEAADLKDKSSLKDKALFHTVRFITKTAIKISKKF